MYKRNTKILIIILIELASIYQVRAQIYSDETKEYINEANRYLKEGAYELLKLKYENARDNFDAAKSDYPNDKFLLNKYDECEAIINGLDYFYNRKSFKQAEVFFSDYKKTNKDAAYYTGIINLLNKGINSNIDTANYYLKLADQLDHQDVDFAIELVNSKKDVLKLSQENSEIRSSLKTKNDELNKSISKNNDLSKKLELALKTSETKPTQIYLPDSVVFVINKNKNNDHIKRILLKSENLRGYYDFRISDPFLISIDTPHYHSSISKLFSKIDDISDLEIFIKYNGLIGTNSKRVTQLKVYHKSKLIKSIPIVLEKININNEKLKSIARLGFSMGVFSPELTSVPQFKPEPGLHSKYKIALYYMIGGYAGVQVTNPIRVTVAPPASDNINDPDHPDNPNVLKNTYLQMSYFEYGVNLMPHKNICFFGGLTQYVFQPIGDFKLKSDNTSSLIYSTNGNGTGKLKQESYQLGLGLILNYFQIEGAYQTESEDFHINVGLNIPLAGLRYRNLISKHNSTLIN